MKALNNVEQDTYFIVYNHDKSIFQYGLINEGQSFITSLKNCIYTNTIEDHYNQLKSLAIEFEKDIIISPSGPPILYNNELYQVLEEIETQEDQTPDIITDLFIKIESPIEPLIEE
jgi:hypothetical protein